MSGDAGKPKRIVVEPEIVEPETAPAVPGPAAPASAVDAEGQQRDLLTAALRSLKSPNTRKAYRGHWTRFAEYHGERPGPFVFKFLALAKADAMDMVNDFADHLEDEDKAASTIAAHLNAIISMVHRWHLAEVSPWTLRGLIKIPQPSSYTDVTGIPPEGVEAMLASVRHLGTAQAYRDLAVLCLLHDSALRRREVVSLDLLHWRPEKRVVFVWGKGQARGVRVPQPVSKRCAAALAAWIEHRGEAPGALFYQVPFDADPPVPITTSTIRGIVDRTARDAGVEGPVSPHRLRHAGITEFYRRTRDPEATRQFARHARFDITTIYIQAVEDVVKTAMDDIDKYDD